MENHSTKEHQNHFSSEEIKNISELGDIFRQIKSRVEKEGISIDDVRDELLSKLTK